MSRQSRIAFLMAFVVSTSALAQASRAAGLHPIERQVREQFPSVVLHSDATLEPVQEFVAGRMVSGMRARGAFRILYPASYDEPFVVELGQQRVVLRAIGAHFAQAEASAGRLFYSRPHDSVDVIEVPSGARSEELLVLHDDRAPRVFEYEIVEMRGVTGVSLQDGAIRFAPDPLAMSPTPAIASGRFTAPRPSLQIDRPWVIDANGQRSETAARWTILEKQDQPRRIRLTINSDALTYPLVVDPTFSATGTMTAARSGHTATLLPDGKVLIAGGTSGSALSTAELYDPATGTFAATSNPMTTARESHTATMLRNGKVLIAGGTNGSAMNTAELYDPASGTFTATTGTMTTARSVHTATLLASGRVLIAGGLNASATLNTAELYDPATGTFTATSAPMTSARNGHTATLLPGGNVLVAGGSTGSTIVDTAELYDPAAGTFTATTAPMTGARQYHTATLLSGGKVLITGGLNGSALSTALLYDPVAGTFAATSAMTKPRYNHTATLLPSGKVLITAGRSSGGTTFNSAELYDPAAAGIKFTATSAPMTSTRFSHTATLLPQGMVLIAGGDSGSAASNTAELYDAATAPSFTATSAMTSARQRHTATLLPNGKVLIAGGTDGLAYLNTAEVFDPAGGVNGTFTPTSSPMITARSYHTATLLPNGKVLIAGGVNGGGATNAAELFDPADGTFTATSLPMISARYWNTATLLKDGEVLIAGGLGTPTAELFNPATGMFTAVIPSGFTPYVMRQPRYKHTATLLADGKVLLAGGVGLPPLAPQELFNPNGGINGSFDDAYPPLNPNTIGYSHTATLLPNRKVLLAPGGGSFGSAAIFSYDPAVPLSGSVTATSAPMTSDRSSHTATLLPSGKVLLTGGGSPLNTAELYDPASGTPFAATTSMTSGRYSHTATLLPNGKVLITGGSNGSAILNTAELYDGGLGYSDSRRPVVSAMTSPLCQPGTLSLSGSGFTGDSEGSNGSTNNSASNAPLLRLQRIDNEKLQFVLPQSFSTSSFLSATLNNLSSGHYRAAVISNAIPSFGQIIDVETTPVLGTYAPAAANLLSNINVPLTSQPAGYDSPFNTQSATGSGGFTGSFLFQSGRLTVLNPGPVGDYTITVSSSNSCGSPTTTFPLKVLGPPSAVMATGGTPQSAQLNTPFATPLQATVTDSAGHLLSNVSVNFTAPLSGASVTFPGGASAATNSSGIATITPTANGNLGSYSVTATANGKTAIFALTNTPVTPPANVVATATTATSVTITWTGTVGSTYEVLRVAAGNVMSTMGTSDPGSLTDTTATANTAYLYKVRRMLPSVSEYSTPDLATTVIFADPSLVSGTTTVKTAHITDLRTAVDAVRALAGKGGGSYTDVALSVGVTLIQRAHVTDLRTALDDARSTLLLPSLSYTRPAIVVGATTISPADINDLRNGVK